MMNDFPKNGLLGTNVESLVLKYLKLILHDEVEGKQLYKQFKRKLTDKVIKKEAIVQNTVSSKGVSPVYSEKKTTNRMETPPDEQAQINTVYPPQKQARHNPSRPFCRIDAERVTFDHDEVRDNSAFMRDMQHPLNRKLVTVRGKNFTKEKQKNKNKVYAVELNDSVRSTKFEDSDE